MRRTKFSNDPANFRDDPSHNGFWNATRFYPYVQGGQGEGTKTTTTTSSNEGGTSTETEDGTGAEDKGKKPDEEKKFTQDEVNALIAREIAQKTRGKVDPTDLGFASRKELETAIEELKGKKEAEKTDADKALEAAVEAAKKEATDTVMSKAQKLTIKAEFTIAAHKAGVEHVDDAFLISQGLEAWKGVEIDDDGKVTGLDKVFFDELEKSKPFLFAEVDENGERSDIGAGAGRQQRGSKPNRETELRTRYSALGPGKTT